MRTKSMLITAISLTFCAVLLLSVSSCTLLSTPAHDETALHGGGAVPRTGSTYDDPCCAREDGELQLGVAWPIPRFITGTTGVVTDTFTGLIWLENANCVGRQRWEDALNTANTLADGACGLNDGSVAGDWRLPNVRELLSLIDFGLVNPALPDTLGTGQAAEGDPFIDLKSDMYWSSTPYAGNESSALRVRLNNGGVYHDPKYTRYFVLPVRDPR